jgi:outer membrane lipoprotein-sorting protein
MNSHSRRRALAYFAFLVLIVASRHAAVEAGSAADNARQIVDEAQKRTTSTSERYEGVLQTFDGEKKTSDKRWTFERIGSHGDSKSVIRFTAPAEVKGVALLIANHSDRASDQWMWTPALERDRRIALQDRSTRFFGTDFSFEDLEERDVNQYDYTLVGEEAIGGALCWKIQTIAKQAKSSQYTKSIIWIRKDNYAYVRIDLYVQNQVVRKVEYSNISSIQGIWTARETRVADLRRGTLTRLALDHVEYNVPLKDERFTLQGIRQQ